MGRELQEVRLNPGFERELTPVLAQASIVDGMFVRWKEGVFEKIGGWTRYYASSMGAIARAIWGWQDVNLNLRLAYGAAPFLKVLTAGVLTDITPQTITTNSAPNFTTVSGSASVTVVDANISNPSVNNWVYIQTPVAVGGIVLYGLYQIATVISTTSYTIIAGAAATGNVSNGGALMTFQTTSGSAFVVCTLTNHGLQAGSSVAIQIPITLGGVTISGNYLAQAPITANAFDLLASAPATGNAGPTAQNGNNVRFTYYITIGPQSPFSGWGVGNWGAGGWGTGTSLPAGTGTPITSTDWSLFNWGEILIANSAGGGIFQWSPESGLTNAQLIGQGPVIADGIFLATPQQILVAWGVVSGQNNQTGSIGTIANIGVLNPLRLVWSDAGNFSNFTATPATFAGGFNLSSGSRIVAAAQGANQFLIWTDVGVWTGTYVGQPLVFAIVEVMKGCGLIGRKAQGVLGTSFFWMSQNQFFSMAAGGAPVPMQCSVWDKVFQNLNKAFVQNVRFFSNAAHNEIGWYYPSATSSGENDSYVKYDVVQNLWDYGPRGRSSWLDQGILGTPIGTSNGTNGEPSGIIYQHEQGNDADGATINWSIRTGDVVIGTGDEMQFMDYVIPDFRWGKEGQPQTATVLFTFFVKSFPGDTPTVQGPFTATQAQQFIEPRLRGRFLSMLIQGQDLGSFVRGGLIRYRASPDGRNP
jgi:hypothetical protein